MGAQDQTQDGETFVPNQRAAATPPAGATDHPAAAVGETFHPNTRAADTSNDPQSPIPENYGFTGGHMLQQAGQGLAEMGKGAYGMAKDIVTPPENDTFGNLGKKYITAPAMAEQQKSQEALNKPGHPVMNQIESFGHGLASEIPMVGPWAAGLGEQAGTGDVGGALARGGTQVAVSQVPRALGVVGKAIPKVAEYGASKLFPKTYGGLQYLNKIGENAKNISDTFSPHTSAEDYWNAQGTSGNELRDYWNAQGTSGNELRDSLKAEVVKGQAEPPVASPKGNPTPFEPIQPQAPLRSTPITDKFNAAQNLNHTATETSPLAPALGTIEKQPFSPPVEGNVNSRQFSDEPLARSTKENPANVVYHGNQPELEAARARQLEHTVGIPMAKALESDPALAQEFYGKGLGKGFTGEKLQTATKNLTGTDVSVTKAKVTPEGSVHTHDQFTDLLKKGFTPRQIFDAGQPGWKAPGGNSVGAASVGSPLAPSSGEGAAYPTKASEVPASTPEAKANWEGIKNRISMEEKIISPAAREAYNEARATGTAHTIHNGGALGHVDISQLDADLDRAVQAGKMSQSDADVRMKQARAAMGRIGH
jgi:hypothetical protein